MTELQKIIPFAIYFLMGITLFWALCAVHFKSLFHSALALTGALIGVAGIYIALQAEFLAIVQVLVYVGAVITIVIFAIMLTEKLSETAIKQNNHQTLPALVLSFGFLAILIPLLLRTPWPKREVLDPLFDADNTRKIGEALLQTYVFPFEILAILLTAALIGALVIAKKEEPS